MIVKTGTHWLTFDCVNHKTVEFLQALNFGINYCPFFFFLSCCYVFFYGLPSSRNHLYRSAIPEARTVIWSQHLFIGMNLRNVFVWNEYVYMSYKLQAAFKVSLPKYICVRICCCVYTHTSIPQLDCLSKLGQYNCCRNATHLYTPQDIIQRHTFAWEIHFFILLFARFVNNSFKNQVRTCQSCL